MTTRAFFQLLALAALPATGPGAASVQEKLEVSINVLPSCVIRIPHRWRAHPRRYRWHIRRYLRQFRHCRGHGLPIAFDDDFGEDRDGAGKRRQRSPKWRTLTIQY